MFLVNKLSNLSSIGRIWALLKGYSASVINLLQFEHILFIFRVASWACGWAATAHNKSIM